MRFIAWNCQRIGSPLTVEALMEQRKKHDPEFFFLNETKKKEEKLEEVRRKLKYGKACYVEPEGLSGGLALWWNEQEEVRVIGKCKNLIDMEVRDEGQKIQLKVFWIYGPTDYDERQEVWRLVKKRAMNIASPWMCVGDFNDILYNYEKEGGRIKDARKIRGFRSMVEESQLIDLKAQGQRFTWVCRREDEVIKERIDRAMVNVIWLESFPRTQVFNLPIVGSDHGPILVDSDFRDGKSKKQFKFELYGLRKRNVGRL